MKLLTFADFHLGVRTYGKLDHKTGLNTREVDTLRVLDEMIDYAINNNIDVIIAAGDMYKNNLPSPTLQNEFNKRIIRAAKSNIITLILDGNHDVGRVETSKSALATFQTLEVDNVFSTKCHDEKIYEIKGKKIKFVFLPTYHTRDEIENIVNNTNTKEVPTIFIGHLTAIGALLNDWLVEKNETYIDINIFNKPGILAVILGHLHKHQILNYNPLIYYPGSTQRVDFNEENQPKGFVVLDIDDNNNVEYEFVEVDSQKFCTIKIDLSNISIDNYTDYIIDEINNNIDKIDNAITRIQIEMDDSMSFNDKKIYSRLTELNASTILPIQKQYNNERRIRNANLTEHITMEKGLELYYKDKSRAKERIKLGKQIIDKLNESTS